MGRVATSMIENRELYQLPTAAQAAEAEVSVLGAMLNSARAIEEVRTFLTADAFYRPAHSSVFSAICAVTDAGGRADPVVVADWLQARNELRAVGGHVYLFELHTAVSTATNALHYAMMIHKAARLRRMIAAGEQLMRALHSADNLDFSLEAIARANLELELELGEVLPDTTIKGLSDWEEFLLEPDQPREWIVENLFEAQDVWMILAPGGTGKSFLSRQICLAIAAGVHPFLPLCPITPKRTLLIDLEVADSMLRSQTAPILEQVYSLGQSVADRGFVWRKQDGLNLRESKDALLLERVVAETRPSFVAIGSLYKAFQKGGSDWDTASEETRAVLDRIRVKYNVCWWLEHHMNRGSGGVESLSGQPYGGATWDKWPTHGRVLAAVKGTSPTMFSFTTTWRGDRDPREVPAGLRQRGRRLPWEAVSDIDIADSIRGAGG